MNESRNAIESCWNSFVETFCSQKRPVYDALLLVLQQYRNSGRSYHNIFHIESMLKVADDMVVEYFKEQKFKFEEYNKEEIRNVVAGAVLFHDVIYDIMSKHNEKDSAEFAECVLNLCDCNKNVIKDIKKIIMATDHENYKINDKYPMDMQLMCSIVHDADLYVLSEEDKVYDEYSHKIRNEYAIIPNNIFNPGRLHVLKKLMANNLYVTDYARQRGWDIKAIKNMEREIKSIEEEKRNEYKDG